MDDKEKNIHVTQGGLSNESDEKFSQNVNHQPQENDIEIPLDDSTLQYDAFMSEPLGFEELDKQHEEQMSALIKQNIKKAKHQRNITILLIIIFVAIILLGVYAIVSDIIQSSKRLHSGFNSNNVVLYQESKPISPDSMYNIDENGKYSTEDVAMIVRPSIVEIYTYYDSLHSSLAGTGSGIIISKDGYIITNAHVLEADGYHVVKTHDDKTYDAEIVGRDSKTDIAVLKINASGLQPATLGDSDEVVVGEEVMAIGNPAGLSGTVTNGIVSAVNRKIKGKTTAFEMDCIQTNADISPGNSGGALVNMYAQVIGITSSKYASTTLEGLGFAISINEAMPIIEELIANGFIGGRFKIGISLIATDEEMARMTVEDELGYSLPEDFYGIYIAKISQDCDIANTELKVGDFITKVEGVEVRNYDELNEVIQNFQANDVVKADCANVAEDGEITEYSIEFKLMEDTSGDY